MGILAFLGGLFGGKKKSAFEEPAPSTASQGAEESFARMAEIDYDRMYESRRRPRDVE